MRTCIEQTNNPLLILACIAVMVLQAALGALLRSVFAAARFIVSHHRILLAMALIVIAIPVTILVAQAVLPVIVAVAGKVLAGGVGTAAFALWARP